MESINARQFLEKPLDGRTAELRLVKTFLRTDDAAPSCLWLQGDPLTGKSALLGRVAQHLWSSPKFDVVGYFLSGADGRDRADHFTGSMVRQLTVLRGGKRPPPANPEEVPRTKLQALFRSAADHSARNGRRLVVVVDGLDQDAAWRGGVPEGERPGTSIASLLPGPAARTGEESGRRRHGKRSIRVIVSSRPAAVPPADVPAEHPLHRAESVRLLRPSPHAGAGEHNLLDGLDRLRDSGLGRTLVGFLATSGAGLRADDLAELTGIEPARIARMLESAWGRCLVPDDLSTGSYVFADEELLRTAWEKTGPDLRAECVRRLHAWADSWLTGDRAGPGLVTCFRTIPACSARGHGLSGTFSTLGARGGSWRRAGSTKRWSSSTSCRAGRAERTESSGWPRAWPFPGLCCPAAHGRPYRWSCRVCSRLPEM
ncbi:ATP-binding protein [Streptomyces cavourensis]|nr:ATP-binding protein [Streptomyces cavourensis]